MTEKGFDRRLLLTGGVAAALAAATPTTAAAAPRTATTAAGPLRAAVLEYADQWTKATGLAELLRRAGFTVVPLDLTRSATDQPEPVDLIAFGSFTNNDSRYATYLSAHGGSLRGFAESGRVVLDLAQSDQYGAAVPYLPESLGAVRTDADHDTIHPVVAGHPLVAGLRTSGGRLFTGRSTSIRVSWETVGEWRSMRVLMACAASGYPPALLEGAHGAGRFLITSLTIDKCFDATGTPVQPELAVADSVEFFEALAAYVGLVREAARPPSRRRPYRPTRRPARSSDTSASRPPASGRAPASTPRSTPAGPARTSRRRAYRTPSKRPCPRPTTTPCSSTSAASARTRRTSSPSRPPPRWPASLR